MDIQYFKRGGYRLCQHQPLEILDAHCPSIMTPSNWVKQKKNHLLFFNSSTPVLGMDGFLSVNYHKIASTERLRGDSCMLLAHRP